MTTLNLERLAGRCAHGFAPVQLSLCADCKPGEWHTFTTALRKAVRDDGTIHQADMRPLIRGQVAPKHVGIFYRRAKSDGLIVDTGEREQSNDVAGKNTDKLDRIYRWVGAR